MLLSHLLNQSNSVSQPNELDDDNITEFGGEEDQMLDYSLLFNKPFQHPHQKTASTAKSSNTRRQTLTGNTSSNSVVGDARRLTLQPQQIQPLSKQITVFEN